MNKIKQWSLLVPLLTSMTLQSAASTENYPSLDQFIEDARKEYRVPGTAVAIVKDDAIAFIKGYGVLEIGKGELVDENTIFQLASGSKTFTAAAVGTLVDKKTMEWNDEIVNLLPAFDLSNPYATRYSTAIDLLAHRTGLPAFQGDLLGQEGYTREQILYRTRFIPLEASFREKSLYSNVGFFVAGELVAKLSRKPFEEAVNTALLRPMKMNRTGFAELLDGDNVAAAHASVNGMQRVINWDRSILFAAAGGVVTSAADLAKWMRMHLNKGTLDGTRVLSKESIDAIFQPAMVAKVDFSEMPPISESTGFFYGLGWNIYYYKGYRIIEKGGALDGSRSLITLIPEKNIGIAILSNLNLTIIPELIRAKFLEDLFGVHDNGLKETFEEAHNKMRQLLAPPKPSSSPLPPSRPAASYTGTFTNDIYGDLVITALQEGKYIAAAGPSKWPGRLAHYNNDTFLLTWPFVNYGNQEVTYTFGPDGNALSIQTETLGQFTRKPQSGDPLK